MGNIRVSRVVVVLFALTGLTVDCFVVAREDASTVGSIDRSMSSGADPANSFDLEKPLREFVGLPADVAAGKSHAVRTKLFDRLRAYEPKVLIATLPDPVDSTVGYRFDLLYSAIQTAIEEAGFTPDRYHVPWVLTDSRPRRNESGNPVQEHPKDASPGAQTNWPGIALFRRVSGDTNRSLRSVASKIAQDPVQADIREPEKGSLLILLLVGETSTWGIHKNAFWEALRLRKQLQFRSSDTSPSTLVLGPYFTGSMPSMQAAIALWHSGFTGKQGANSNSDQFVILSGSVTGVKKHTVEQPFGGLVHFSTTVHNDESRLRAIIHYIRIRSPLSATSAKIALLGPIDTAFGQKIQDMDIIREEHILCLPLPIHIANARSVLADGDDTFARLATGKTNSKSANMPPLPFDDNQETSDVLPPFHGQVSAKAEYLLLAKTLATLSREDARYVGIVSSDARDKMFLMKLVAKYCPDVQVFFTDNDVLLTFPEMSRYMEGALAVSSYPMFSASQGWDFPNKGERRRLLFSNEFDQGYYNASLLLLGNAFGKTNAGDAVTDLLLDYGYPTVTSVYRPATSYPPLWISIIGKYGPWPVTVMNDVNEGDRTISIHENLALVRPSENQADDQDNQQRASGDNSQAEKGGRRASLSGEMPLRFTVPWILEFTVATLICLLLCHAYIRAFPAPARTESESDRSKWNRAYIALIEYFRPVHGKADLALEQRVHITFLFIVLIVFYALAVWAGFLPLLYMLTRNWHSLIPGSLTLALLAVGIAGVLSSAENKPTARDSDNPTSAQATQPGILSEEQIQVAAYFLWRKDVRSTGPERSSADYWFQAIRSLESGERESAEAGQSLLARLFNAAVAKLAGLISATPRASRRIFQLASSAYVLIGLGFVVFACDQFMAVAVPVVTAFTLGSLLVFLGINWSGYRPDSSRHIPFWFYRVSNAWLAPGCVAILLLGFTPLPGYLSQLAFQELDVLRRITRSVPFFASESSQGIAYGILLSIAAVLFLISIKSLRWVFLGFAAVAYLPAAIYFEPSSRFQLLNGYFDFQRTVQLSSSISPTNPALLVGAALACWPLYHLRRCQLIHAFHRMPSFGQGNGSRGIPELERLGVIDNDLRATIMRPCQAAFMRPLPLAVAIGLIALLVQIVARRIPTVENVFFNVATTVALTGGAFLYLFVLLHTYRLYGQYREFLRRLAMLPMAGDLRSPSQQGLIHLRQVSQWFRPAASQLADVYPAGRVTDY